jgi:AraC-like DNA-binding protein
VHEPDGATALVVRAMPGGRRDVQVVGPRTRGTYTAAEHPPTCVRIRIQPGGARPLLGVPVSELVDRVVPLTDLWGMDALRLHSALDELSADVGTEAVRTRLESALLARLSAQPSVDLSRTGLLRAAAEALAPHPGGRPEPVGSVARRLAISERHLRDLFAQGIGVSPKRFARIERVRGVLAGGRAGRWARLATETGYYDQSHMTVEFRTLMGVPPGAYFAGRLPEARPCAPGHQG